MIKIQYEFDSSQEKEVREFIDRAKWKQVVIDTSIHLMRQSNNETIPEAEQMLYHRLRLKILELVHNSGLTM
jgi:hypothetical protein